METREKKEIVAGLEKYCNRYDSQNKAAASLKNVSAATISNMLNGKHDLIKDEMWRNVAAQVLTNKDWQIVETSVYNELYFFFKDAQDEKSVSAIVGNAGCGKTATSKKFVAENKEAYRLECSEFWNRKTFLVELMGVLGLDPSGYTNNMMMQIIIKNIQDKENPLIILDEADKLADQVLLFFITLYNKLEDRCGIILMATDHLEKRINKGVALNKKGYNEIVSRIGKRFIKLDGNTSEDISRICQSNGVTDSKSIDRIIGDSDADLRRVKKLTRADVKKNAKSVK